jgi:trichohyalin
MKEAIHLEDQLTRQHKARLAATRAEIRDTRAEQREKLQAAYDKVNNFMMQTGSGLHFCLQEMAELVSNSAGLSPSELAQRKEELKRKYKHQLADFDRLTEELVLKAEKDLLPQLEIEEMNARLSLREKQLRELADAMKRLTPEEELQKQYEEDARKAEETAKNYQDDVVRRMREEMEEKRRKMLEEEEMKKRKMEEDLK